MFRFGAIVNRIWSIASGNWLRYKHTHLGTIHACKVVRKRVRQPGVTSQTMLQFAYCSYNMEILVASQ